MLKLYIVPVCEICCTLLKSIVTNLIKLIYQKEEYLIFENNITLGCTFYHIQYGKNIQYFKTKSNKTK